MAALQTIGLSCYHGTIIISDIYEGHSPADFWRAALDAKFHPNRPPTTTLEINVDDMKTPEFWDQVLGPYAAVSDVPMICFAEELLAAYPEAKVLLMERDLDVWERSFAETILRPAFSPMTRAIAWLDPGFIGQVHKVLEGWCPIWFGTDVAPNPESVRRRIKAKYREHYDFVRSLVPEERLLVLKVGSKEKLDWEPLCSFLGKEPPAGVPFPRVNEKDEIAKYVAGLLKKGFWRFVIKATSAGLAVGAAGLGAYLGWLWLK
jgi:hypothetical protein